MLFFKDKKRILLENKLKDKKLSLSDKMETLKDYFLYLKEKDTKQESIVFMEIIKKLKDKETIKIQIGKELLFFNDKKNRRILLHYKFMNIIAVLSQVEVTMILSTLENLQPYLDIFVTESGEKLRIDFKNTMSTKSIDLDYYKKKNDIVPSEYIKLLSKKNIFLFHNIQINGDSYNISAKEFFEIQHYLTEKTYPALIMEEYPVLVYMNVKQLDQKIQDNNAKYMSFGDFLDNVEDVKIKLETSHVILCHNLLNRNSNFYIISK